MPCASFSGPWARGLDDFIKSLGQMPAQHHAAFSDISDTSRAIICNKSYLHIWETDSDIDSLLQLTQVIVKIRNMSTYVPQPTGPPKSVPAGMLILVEHVPSRDNFGRVCELVKHLTEQEGRAHLNGGVMSFGGIKVVRGVDNSQTPSLQQSSSHTYGSQEAETNARKAVERINKAITRILDSGAYSTDTKKLIWHHGPALHFLNFWINNTSHDLRSKLAGITVHSVLQVSASSITLSGCPSQNMSNGKNHGVHNQKQDLLRLQNYCTKLDIPAVLLDIRSQRIVHPHLATYMYFYPYYIHTFLPASLLTPHYHLALDHLATYSFRLHNAAVTRKFGSNTAKDVVRDVQQRLPASKARAWAKRCIQETSYADKKQCQDMARDDEIYTAVQLADAPYKTFSPSNHTTGATGLKAFSRLTMGPAADGIAGHYACVPMVLEVDETGEKVRMKSGYPGPFRLYLPTPSSPSSSASSSSDEEIERVTERIRGVMVAVLELVRQGKGTAGTPTLSKEDGEVWREVAKTCCWALEECKGKLPRGVEEKIAFVIKALKGGMWTWCLGLAEGGQAQAGGMSGMGRYPGRGAGGDMTGQMGYGQSNGWAGNTSGGHWEQNAGLLASGGWS
ncbi:uncharacterized protein EI97DRAFT_435348 [Westerdykella ornata]|uniref:Uncharacterized protein n=1 Tax=Westerdykella ornata TaxID=318751 RepID=A0A6A6JCG3_WESOR|nr:uncharacterized protein EI97DRAFT_435348 [Westerdykella ornata]KAF2274251.1 hypothetical protein EI97DRAFT_435348 [Westerdykella ornata]